jgi:hypothetical protein
MHAHLKLFDDAMMAHADVHMQLYVSVGFTVFAIFFLVHVLTCAWHVVGDDMQTFSTGKSVNGWVVEITDPETGLWNAETLLVSSLVQSAFQTGISDCRLTCTRPHLAVR